MTDKVSIKEIVGLIERLEDSLRRTITDLAALRQTEVLVPTPSLVTVKPVFPDMPVGKKRGPKPYSEMTVEEIAAAKARKAANKAANSVKEPKMTIIKPEMIGAPSASEPPPWEPAPGPPPWSSEFAVPAPMAVAAPMPTPTPVKPKRVIKLKK